MKKRLSGAAKNLCWKRRLTPIVVRLSPPSPAAAARRQRLRAAKAAKRILLANKEALILCGQSLIRETEKSGGELLPIDSEHCGLFEMMMNKRPYRRLWLTASGGALRDRPLSDLSAVKSQDALQHPTWSMGKKITIDSATLMNKSLEILEAAVLFSANAENIAVIMHPQSIVHAFLEYADGGMTAQLSVPDMKLPIARMLDWPHITPMQRSSPDWESLSRLSFSPPDEKRYPCLRLPIAPWQKAMPRRLFYRRPTKRR